MADLHNNAGSAAGTVSTGRRSGGHDAVRYAHDNRFVRAVHALTTGPLAPLLLVLLVVAVALGIYFPVRSLYVAYRSQYILEQQIAIRTAYNEALEEEVEALLSEEGIQDYARKELGMVMEGETAVTVTGLDEDGNAVVVETESDSDAESDAADSTVSDDAAADDADDTAASSDSDAQDDASEDSTPTTAAEVEAAEAAVFEDSPWYWKVLDAIFFFDGTGGQAVVSTGE